MKLSLATLAFCASGATAYNVGGFDSFGRPYVVSPRGRYLGRKFGGGPRCSPQQNGRDCVDRAFEDLRNELKNDRFQRPNRDFAMDEETIRQQEEWVNRAFGLASDVAKGFASSPSEAKAAETDLRQQKEWVNRAFGFARDISSGGAYSSLLRAEVLQDDDKAFQVAIDVPGVKTDNIDVTVEGTKDKILVVRGERDVGGEEARKFSKVIALDARSDTAKLSAYLENGVLVVSVPRMAIESTESTQKISVNKVYDESMPCPGEAEAFPFELELDVPGVLASNIDIIVEGDIDKTLTITAVREVGKDNEGKPRKKETSKSFKVDEIVDTSKIVANLSNGVLKVSAPADEKKTEEIVRKIAVRQSADSSNSAETRNSPSDSVEDNKADPN